MTALALAAAALSAALLFPASGEGAGHRGSRRWTEGGVRTAAAVVPVVVLLGTADGTGLALGLVVTAAVAAAVHMASSARRRRASVINEARMVELCEALSAELRGGQPGAYALRACARTWEELAPAAAAASLSADVPSALRRLGRQPGCSAMSDVAAAWQVSQASGSGLVLAVGQVSQSVRARKDARRLVSSELASAQATARLLALLPVVVLTMGSGIGGSPWHFLLHTPAGVACLGLGLGLAFLGLVWVDRIGSVVTDA